MPKRFVHDIDIMYEAYGHGETIVYLQSVLGGINPGAYYFAGRMSNDFRVIIWDGPNHLRAAQAAEKWDCFSPIFIPIG